MNGLKVRDEYGNILTVHSIVDNIVKVYERINDTIHASKLFVNGKSLVKEDRNDR